LSDLPREPNFDITPVSLEEEMKRSYLDYAMSVIVSRALPDVRDGLKPVHRRVLYAMQRGGYTSGKKYNKSAKVVGEVMGQYHPHGDASIYDTLVRMGQDFSMRVTLIDGQGNYGSMDGDPPAAMRYTETRLSKAGEALLDDLDKDTVDFRPTYDESGEEPVVLPARFPNLLVNGAGGIAVGMATTIPTHNLGEVVDACIAAIDNPGITIDQLMEIVPGPDFPTGGIILGRNGILSAYHTGGGSIAIRGRATIEEIRKDRMAIVITEIPYQVNKARLVERIAEVVNQKIVEGISDLRDESDRDGVRVVVELKRDANADVVLAQLYKFTQLQTSMGVNMVALKNGQPAVLNLKDIITAFVDFRREVITRRTNFDLNKARDRAHVLVGLAVAVANIDEVIALIRKAPDAAAAREALMGRDWPASDVAPLIALIDEPGYGIAADGTYRMSEAQAVAILELRLQRLTGLEQTKIAEELNSVADDIRRLLDILEKPAVLTSIMKNELIAVRDAFATPRKTQLEALEFEADIESLIQREDMVVTISQTGYIKRTPLSTYRTQARGGRGRAGMSTKSEDIVTQLFVANTHTPVLFFTSRGMVYTLKVYRLPLGSPTSPGKALVNLLPIEKGETISTVMPVPEDEAAWAALNIVFATSHGTVRRNLLSDFENIRANGLIAMKLGDGERLVAVSTCEPEQDLVLATRGGRCIRFAVDDVRVFAGRTSTGVRGIKLVEDDEVISLSVLNHVEATPEERGAYLSSARRGRGEGDESEATGDPDMEGAPGAVIDEARFIELETKEQFLLTVTARGFGKRSSAYGYRITGRGGQGIWNIDMSERNGEVVATCEVRDDDELMLVTDRGQMIRMPIAGVRIASRKTQGVILFRTEPGERVVSAAVLAKENAVENGEDADAGAATVPTLSPDTPPAGTG
jgi:DNA gyrase subunit A